MNDGAFFRYEPQNHGYYLGKDRIPGVTTIIGTWIRLEIDHKVWWLNTKDLTLVTGPVFEHARKRGSDVHLGALLLLTKMGLDWDALDPEVAGHLLMVQAWAEHYRPQIILVERPMADFRLRFAGTPDIIAKLRGYRHPAIIDIKTGDPGHVAIQTAAYEHLWRTEDGYKGLADRWCLHTSEDSYEFEQIGRATDFQHFKIKLADYNLTRAAA